MLTTRHPRRGPTSRLYAEGQRWRQHYTPARRALRTRHPALRHDSDHRRPSGCPSHATFRIRSDASSGADAGAVPWRAAPPVGRSRLRPLFGIPAVLHIVSSARRVLSGCGRAGVGIVADAGRASASIWACPRRDCPSAVWGDVAAFPGARAEAGGCLSAEPLEHRADRVLANGGRAPLRADGWQVPSRRGGWAGFVGACVRRWNRVATCADGGSAALGATGRRGGVLPACRRR